MNLKRGLFRLWAVASVLFALCVILVSFSAIREQFRIENTDWDAEISKYGGYTELPTFCNFARGDAGKDYEERDRLCWYRTETFQRLYPEYKDLSSHDLSEKLYAKVGQPLQHQHPWRSVATTAAAALGVPGAVLILGWLLFWAAAGFRR